MKIGILTLPIHRNYGGILQAYALQTALKREGHDVWIIRREVQQLSWTILPLVLSKRIIQKILFGNKKKIFREREELRQLEMLSRNTNRFVTKFMQPQTVSIFHSGQFYKLKQYQFDAIIVGSDQVWRKQYTPKLEDYFLQFLSPKSKTLRIAYAASFGTESWEYLPKQTKLIRSLITQFRAVSVREDSAREHLSKHLGYDQAKHVLDPVLLLEPKDYEELIADSRDSHTNAKLFAYVLDKRPEKQSLIREIGANLSYDVFEIGLGEGDQSLPMSKKIAPPVEDWLRGLIQSKFIITDSFHACAFAILFNKPFLVFGNEGRGLSRFKSLLADFELTDRLISSDNIQGTALNFNPIDWNKVNTLLRNRREFSIQFIREALKG